MAVPSAGFGAPVPMPLSGASSGFLAAQCVCRHFMFSASGYSFCYKNVQGVHICHWFITSQMRMTSEFSASSCVHTSHQSVAEFCEVIYCVVRFEMTTAII